MLQFSAHYSFNFTYYSSTMTIILFRNAYTNNVIQLHQHLLYCNIADICFQCRGLRFRKCFAALESVWLVLDGADSAGFPLEDEEVPCSNLANFTRGMRTAHAHYMPPQNLALFSIHIHTHYSQNYASIIYQGLLRSQLDGKRMEKKFRTVIRSA